MAKRKRVPAALHSELTEYSSLIRALRTSKTLDVAVHLTQPSPPHSPHDDDLHSHLDHPPSQTHVSISPSHSRHPTPVADPKPPRKKRKRATQTDKRDSWTRWPLLAGDVHVPEWGLGDEINLLMSHVLKRSGPPRKDDSGDPDEHGEEDASYLAHLTAATSNHLSTILALIAAHTPMRAQSMQNRIEPIGCQTVLDVLSSYGDALLIDEQIIHSVRTRIEALYGPPEVPSLAEHRIKASRAARQKAADLSSRMNAELFNFSLYPTNTDEPAGPPPPLVPKKKMKSNRKKDADADAAVISNVAVEAVAERVNPPRKAKNSEAGQAAQNPVLETTEAEGNSDNRRTLRPRKSHTVDTNGENALANAAQQAQNGGATGSKQAATGEAKKPKRKYVRKTQLETVQTITSIKAPKPRRKKSKT